MGLGDEDNVSPVEPVHITSTSPELLDCGHNIRSDLGPALDVEEDQDAVRSGSAFTVQTSDGRLDLLLGERSDQFLLLGDREGVSARGHSAGNKKRLMFRNKEREEEFGGEQSHLKQAQEGTLQEW